MREFLAGLAIVVLVTPYWITGPSQVAQDTDLPDLPGYQITEWHADGVLADTDYWYVETFGPRGVVPRHNFRILHAEAYFFGDRRLRFVSLDIFRERPDELAGGGDTPAWWFTAKSLFLDVTLRLIHGPNFFRLSIPPCCETYDLGLREWGAIRVDWDEYGGWEFGRWP